VEIVFTLFGGGLYNRGVRNKPQKSLIDYILSSLIPFTKENLVLATNPRKFFWEIDRIQREYSTSKETVHSTISRAKREGYLKEVELNQQKTFSLTPKGKLKIAEYLSAENSKAWDGKWRILLFDIPEKDRYKRDVLRHKIKELGFKQHQLSAWICPFDYTEELEYLVNKLDLEQHVQYFIGDSIKGEDDLRKKFSLH